MHTCPAVTRHEAPAGHGRLPSQRPAHPSPTAPLNRPPPSPTPLIPQEPGQKIIDVDTAAQMLALVLPSGRFVPEFCAFLTGGLAGFWACGLAGGVGAAALCGRHGAQKAGAVAPLRARHPAARWPARACIRPGACAPCLFPSLAAEGQKEVKKVNKDQWARCAGAS